MKLVTQTIDTPDRDYPENYGSITAVVTDTETGATATASCEYDLFTKSSDAQAQAIQDAMNKL
jgi:hypothetical protein